MWNHRRPLIAGGFLLLVLGFGGGWSAASLAKNLYINGKVASTNLFERNGRTYAPIADIAREMDMELRKRPDGFELISRSTLPPAPTPAVFGKLGEPIANGQLTLTVVEVIRKKYYKKRYTWGDETANRGYEFLAVVCHLRNDTGRKAVVDLVGDSGTTLNDTLDRAYLPTRRLASDAPAPNVTLLPQAAVEFAVLFEVPERTFPREFRYEVLMTQDSKFRKVLFRIDVSGKNQPPQ